MSFFQNLLLSFIMAHDCMIVWLWHCHVTVTDMWYQVMPISNSSFWNKINGKENETEKGIENK